ncbi:MAG: hypothetical protein N2482_00920 [Patescibacteria group bacterium]|nr:hypothetical protein [Patescibacteria group bacterium]
MSFWQENKIPLAIVFSGLLIAFSIYFALKPFSLNSLKTSLKTEIKEKTTENNQEVVSPTTANITITNTISVTEKLSPTTDVPHLDENQIKQGLINKTTIPTDKLEYEIGERLNRENKILIRGVVKNKEEISGAGFFAYCDLEKCEVTYVGQGVPKCSQVNPYNYPLNWADYCVDTGGNTVAR